MLIYQRNIFFTVLKSVIGAILLITAFVWLAQVIKLIYLFGKGVSFSKFLYITLLLLPYLFFAILPFAVTIGAIVAYNKLYNDRELLILNSSGVKPSLTILPLLRVGIIFTVLAYACSLYLLPTSYSKLKSTLSYFRNNFVVNIIQEKVFTQITKNITVYVDEKEYGLLRGVIVFDYTNNALTILFAEKGKIIVNDELSNIELYNGMRQILNDKQQSLNYMSFSELSVPLHHNSCNDDIYSSNKKCVEYVETTNRSLQEYFINELFYPNVTNNDQLKLVIEGIHRVTWPLYNILAPIIAISIFIRTPYRRTKTNDKLLAKIAVCIVAVFIVHFAVYNVATKHYVLGNLMYITVVFWACISYYLTIKE